MTEISEDILKKVIKERESDTHKGDYGRVLLIGGSENYGALLLCLPKALLMLAQV